MCLRRCAALLTSEEVACDFIDINAACPLEQLHRRFKGEFREHEVRRQAGGRVGIPLHGWKPGQAVFSSSPEAPLVAADSFSAVDREVEILFLSEQPLATQSGEGTGAVSARYV